MNWKFKEERTFEKRIEESENILRKYPSKIPIILEKGIQSLSDLSDLEQRKYLVPNDITIAQFTFIIRKRLKLKPEDHLYIYFDIQTPLSAQSYMDEIYNKYADEDKFLYLFYTRELLS